VSQKQGRLPGKEGVGKRRKGLDMSRSLAGGWEKVHLWGETQLVVRVREGNPQKEETGWKVKKGRL